MVYGSFQKSGRDLIVRTPKKDHQFVETASSERQGRHSGVKNGRLLHPGQRMVVVDLVVQ